MKFGPDAIDGIRFEAEPVSPRNKGLAGIGERSHFAEDSVVDALCVLRELIEEEDSGSGRRGIDEGGADELLDHRRRFVMGCRACDGTDRAHVHIARHDGHLAAAAGREGKESVNQPQPLFFVGSAGPVIADVVFEILSTGDPLESCFEESEGRIHEGEREHHEQMTGWFGGFAEAIDPGDDGIKIFATEDLGVGAAAAQVRREDGEFSEVKAEAVWLLTVCGGLQESGDFVDGAAVLLKQSEVFCSGLKDALIDGALMPFGWKGAPAIEDVVVIPHHQGGDRGECGGGFRFLPAAEVQVEEEIVGLSGHQRPERSFFILAGFAPINERGSLSAVAPDGVSIDLIAAHQEQVCGAFFVACEAGCLEQAAVVIDQMLPAFVAAVAITLSIAS
ncbi:MAG: hypothetical protein RL215_227 [Planctomycetota bacterium]